LAVATETKVRVLGIDPGTRVAGYAILDIGRGRRVELVACGAIRMPAGPVPPRLEHLYRVLEDLIVEHRPAALAVETIFHGKSFQSVAKVGEARGVVLVQARLHGLEIAEFPPARVKKTVTGNGAASKLQVQRMVTRLLGLEEPPEPADVSDAIAIAFCYGHRRERQRLAGREPVREIARRSRSAQREKWQALVAKAEARARSRTTKSAQARSGQSGV